MKFDEYAKGGFGFKLDLNSRDIHADQMRKALANMKFEPPIKARAVAGVVCDEFAQVATWKELFKYTKLADGLGIDRG